MGLIYQYPLSPVSLLIDYLDGEMMKTQKNFILKLK